MTDIPEPQRLAWTQIKFVRQIQDLAVTIVASDESPSPEYIVLIVGPPLGMSEVTRCDRSAGGALAAIIDKADLVADVLEIAECSWAPPAEAEIGRPA
ncbi:hypothetical protein P7D22_21450 [Lichenihabitans sp. Uapishka_5]|uniref:hypothetical protein n=1 Tax=Lichenihabitans sp. Uapishka_5 TaxID=3037302 RepID=UPI0029E827B4|nr:hypothetical protein [Lichenihabitans sp. Uapishka_5]MDX7953734.1 hypothetical protein [Lichenihabitans sp. Uapishka_5]